MMPCTVGLTGGLASGKSTVAAQLADLGAAVIDADALVHELYRSGGKGARVVAELFGEQVLAADGSVNRVELGALVLDDEQALQRLNCGIHPLVREGIAVWLEAVGEPVAVVEAALLVETGSFRNYDLLVVVSCEPEQQLERAVARGMVRERAERMLRNQMPLAEKAGHADVVVRNSGPTAALAAEVRRTWAEINDLCRTPRATRSDNRR